MSQTVLISPRDREAFLRELNAPGAASVVSRPGLREGGRT